LIGIHPGVQEEEREGRELNDYLGSLTNVRGVYLTTPDYFCSAEGVLKESIKGFEHIPFFGIKASLLPEYQNFGYEAGGELIEHRLFALVFHGEKLSIRTHYNLGWTPVGKIMTVTKEENPFFVDEIDGKPATHVYNKYLGLNNDQIIPENLSEFPLIIYRDNIKISRIGISGPKEGQLLFGAPVYPNDRISLSYGNPDDLFEEVKQDSEEIGEFDPQAGILITCANRVMLLKEREQEEIELYKHYMKSAAVVYGYAEIFSMNGKGGELNSALVSVAFREDVAHSGNDETTNEPVYEAAEAHYSTIVPFADRLSRFFKEMSNDLLTAAREAEAANRTKSVYYSCISHEIRTPLNAILGMNEMILRECVEDNIRDYAGNIANSGKMLMQIINDILDSEKIEAGKMKIIPVEYNINKVVKELSDMIFVSAESKGLKLRLEIADDLPSVLIGDETRIRQCTLNLLNNAVKYTDNGDVIFRVTAEPVDNKHTRLNISVSDTGIGIKPEDIEKLSMPFERVDQSRNYNIEGTGLGLSIVKRLLGLMGTSLKISSTYGQGSEFSFAIIQENGTEDSSSGSHNAEQNGLYFGSGEGDSGNEDFRNIKASVLVVDDNAVNIKIVKLFLKNTQLDIDTASSGSAAIEMAGKKKYDIIFLDYRMPEIDGLEAYRQIKAEKEGINTDSVFIMLTASDETSAREMFMKEGFDDYLPKPLQIRELEEILRKHLSGY
jgi:signal transduction histidine kinase/CheY-like chemotaxis protein